MAIKRDLEQLRHTYPECMIAAFADISTGMVLSASHRSHLHQEHLDALCSTATDILRGETSLAIVNHLASGPQPEIIEALMLNPNEVGLFICAPGFATDALCCACRPDIALDEFQTHARACFMSILSQLSERKAV